MTREPPTSPKLNIVTKINYVNENDAVVIKLDEGRLSYSVWKH